MSFQGSEIIAGIDFGTTHSGVSWATNSGSKNIRLINNWPDPGAQNASKEKVPSSISYLNGKPLKWGYVVGLNDESFRWIKILLEENHQYATTVEPVKNSSTLLRKVEKTAQGVVADYLKLLWDYTIEDIQKHYPGYEELFTLRVVLTVPAIWSPAAKDRTLQAARLAGMRGDIQLVTEPEAAALATLKEKAEENQLKVGDAFIVCDAGGGTVDLISYNVMGLDPLKLKECAVGSGDLCGSAFLDMAFQKYIETLVGVSQWQKIKEAHRKRMMRDFEFGVKRCFTGHDDPDFSVDLIGVQDDPPNGIIDDTITLKSATLVACFDQVAQKIQWLVTNQIADVEERGLSVKAVLLVGGFGESPYLYNRLKACYEPRGVSIMSVRGAWSSVCRGATLWGLEHQNSDSEVAQAQFSSQTSLHNPNSTITSRLSRYNYGLLFNQQYDSQRHLPQDLFKDLKTGHMMARNQMEWLLMRGDEVEEGRVLTASMYRTIEVGFWDSGMRQWSTNLYYCDTNIPSTRLTDAVKPLCTVNYEIDCSKLWREKSFKGADGKKHRNASFQILIVLGNAGMDFLISYKSEIVGHAEAKYLDKFD